MSPPAQQKNRPVSHWAHWVCVCVLCTLVCVIPVKTNKSFSDSDTLRWFVFSSCFPINSKALSECSFLLPVTVNLEEAPVWTLPRERAGPPRLAQVRRRASHSQMTQIPQQVQPQNTNLGKDLLAGLAGMMMMMMKSACLSPWVTASSERGHQGLLFTHWAKLK